MNELTEIQVQAVIALAVRASDEVMRIYQQDFAVDFKDDESPITQADLHSHRCIVEGLLEITPGLPVLSEESSDEVKSTRIGWQTYWLVDPLDGTKEFVKKNGEFTVNIALIHDHYPVFGVVYAPALNVMYWGGRATGSYKMHADGNVIGIASRIPPNKRSECKIVGSRSHQSEEFKAFVANYPGADIVSMGSSLKLCLVAEGLADLYPRLGLTSEWDTAAAQAVVEGAGGSVISLQDGLRLSCNKNPETLLNPFFIVSGEGYSDQ